MCRVSNADAAANPLDIAVARLVQGDELAFQTVYRAVNPGLVRYLLVLVGRDDAEDVASETWAQAFRDLARFTGDGDAFRAWIATIGRHRAIDHFRARARRPTSDRAPDDLGEPATSQDAFDGAVEAMSTAAALALVATLPRDQAEAVMLRAVMGLTAELAGEVLGKRPGAVRTAAYRGLRTLAERLGSAADAPAPGQTMPDPPPRPEPQ